MVRAIGLYLLFISTVVGQRYWNCDPYCATACSEKEAQDPVCSYIQDVTLLAVSFVSKCHFECANKCYLNALKIYNQGDCEGLPPTSSEEAELKKKKGKGKRRKKRALFKNLNRFDVEVESEVTKTSSDFKGFLYKK